MKSKIITTIPSYNSQRFIVQTLESLARQTMRPDRVVVIDDCSTDNTEALVRNFSGIPCEFVRNPTNLGLFQNFNRCLELAGETEFLHILHADDTIKPEFYAVMSATIGNGAGRALGWCIDERIDENSVHLSLSGKANGVVQTLSRDEFLQRKAEIGNQAFCATLLRTNYQAIPCQFPLDYPILGDMIFWAAFGAHCQKIVHVKQALADYRWHGSNETVMRLPKIQSLIFDEWRTMETNEALRAKKMSLARQLKLKGLLAVRSGIKAKRLRQNGNSNYAQEVVKAGRGITGPLLWLAGQVLVELRDFYLFKVMGRTRHPKNIYG